MTGKRWSRAGAILLGMMLVFLFFYWRLSLVPIDSDYANLVLEGRDMMRGNILLRGWYLTAANFATTQLPFHALASLFFGASCKTSIVANALIDTCLVGATLYMVWEKLAGPMRLMKCSVFFVCALCMNLVTHELLRAHSGVFLWSMVALILYRDCLDNGFRNGKKLTAFGILVALAAVGDLIVAIYLVLPLCIIALVLWLQEKIGNKEFFISLGSNIVSLLTGIVLSRILYPQCVTLGNDGFIDLEEFYHKLVLYIRCLLIMGDAEFEGKVFYSVWTVFYALNVILIIAFWVIVIRETVRFIRGKSYDLYVLASGLGFALLSFVFIFTTLSVDYMSLRYITMFPFILPVVLIRFIAEKEDKIRPNPGNILLIAAVLLVIGRCMNMFIDVGSTERNELGVGVPGKYIELRRELEARGLNNGYAPFYSASFMTVHTDEEITIRAVNADAEGNVGQMTWGSKTSWYEPEAHFVMVVDSDVTSASYDEVVERFGEPSETLVIEDMTVLIYEQDISLI